MRNGTRGARRAALGVAIAAALTAAAPAHAVSAPDTAISSCDVAALDVTDLSCAVAAGDEAVVAALADQYASVWVDADGRGWSAGLAPGALDADAARAGIAAQLATRLPAADAGSLLARLRLVPQPYGLAELTRTLEAITTALGETPLLTSAYVGTATGAEADAVRVRMTVWDPAAPGVVPAAVLAAVAPHGDRVVVTAETAAPVLDSTIAESRGLPDGAVAKGARGIGRYVLLGSCARDGRVRVALRPGIRGRIQEVLVVADRRHRIAGRRVHLAFGVKTTASPSLRIVVRLRDGTALTRTVRVRACR